MRSGPWRSRALVAVLALLAPFAQAAFVTAYQLADHDHLQANHQDVLQVLFHGHAHTEAAPSHTHAWVAPVALGYTRVTPQAHYALPPAAFAAGAWGLDPSDVFLPYRGSHPRPPEPGPLFSILRI